MLISKSQHCGVIVVIGYKRNCEALFCGLLISWDLHLSSGLSYSFFLTSCFLSLVNNNHGRVGLSVNLHWFHSFAMWLNYRDVIRPILCSSAPPNNWHYCLKKTKRISHMDKLCITFTCYVCIQNVQNPPSNYNPITYHHTLRYKPRALVTSLVNGRQYYSQGVQSKWCTEWNCKGCRVSSGNVGHQVKWDSYAFRWFNMCKTDIQSPGARSPYVANSVSGIWLLTICHYLGLFGSSKLILDSLS